MLDEVDKELERRGYSFTRYADDCNVYVGSWKSGERVMALLKRLYSKLHLRVNESKSAVASAYGRKFLGYSFWAAKGKVVKLRVADKAQKAYRQRVRQLTRRIGGKGMAEVAHKLKQYVNGWKAYFKLADTPKVWRELDEWIRHRLRAIHLRQWKRGRTMYRELTKLDAPQGVTERVVGKLPADGRFVSIQQLGNLSLIVSGFHKGVDLISFNLAEMFVVHGQLRLAGQEALNAKHSQPPSLQLIKVALRA